uniref:Solute carrier family 19 member 1 n=1 Tax=Gorilla gorilla gorilla TaxID=9595 RepID=A0A2I2YQ92_GORGO
MVPSSPAVEKQVPVEPGPDPELRSWQRLVCYLCFYGFMAQIRPGESFITPYLLGPDKNFTREQVTNEITPVLSYSYLAVLVPVFLLTDYLRYTPVLLLQGLSFVSVWLLLLLGHSVAHMQLMELFYSVTMAARIAYSSYIFSLVRPARYQRVAGYSRAAVLLGVFTSSVLGQLLVTVGRVSFSTLNYISLAFLTFSVVLALFLKRPKRSLFFNRDDRGRCETSASELERMNPGPGGKLGHALRVACGDSVLARMLRELGDSLRRPQLRLWSLWWVFNSAGYYLVVYYVHILWNEVDPTTNSARVYNGAADAASTLLGTHALVPEAPSPGAGLQAFPCGCFSFSQQRLICPLFPFSFQIASSLSKELCALVFGVNTFFATIVKTIITFIVSDVRGLGLPVRKQALRTSRPRLGLCLPGPFPPQSTAPARAGMAASSRGPWRREGTVAARGDSGGERGPWRREGTVAARGDRGGERGPWRREGTVAARGGPGGERGPWRREGTLAVKGARG